ncbi:MAG: peptide chain release factor 2 [Bdellovibrionota bacterium]
MAFDAHEVRKQLNELAEKNKDLGGIFEISIKEKRLIELEAKSQDPSVWEKPSELQKINKEKSVVTKTVGDWKALDQRIQDALVMLEMAVEAGDDDTYNEVKTEAQNLVPISKEMEIKTMLKDPMDANSTFLSINSGAGGTEACDWASMLMRMYLMYADKQGFKTDILEQTDGDGAGIKSVTLHIEGPYAFGFLKAEAGVHRLVRISPFDSNARRHTSFAAVFAWPEVDDDINIEIKTEDLRIETYRAGGAGGQHVNKTDSAVRLTHIPTGAVVQCQNQRSQLQNREKAMKMLKAALYELEMQKREAEKNKMNSVKKANEWGSQIRSYVMHPYQLAKDHRTGHETSQVADVMDGDIQPFIEEQLKSQVLKTIDSKPKS